MRVDESTFEPFGNKRRVHIKRRPREGMIDKLMVLSGKHGGRPVMVWGCFGGRFVFAGDLIQIKRIL